MDNRFNQHTDPQLNTWLTKYDNYTGFFKLIFADGTVNGLSLSMKYPLKKGLTKYSDFLISELHTGIY